MLVSRRWRLTRTGPLSEALRQEERAMAHPVGERFRCDDCGAEIAYVAACECPAEEPQKHAHVCCGQEMRCLGVVTAAKEAVAPSSVPKKSAA
jgi:hypothetical protein